MRIIREQQMLRTCRTRIPEVKRNLIDTIEDNYHPDERSLWTLLVPTIQGRRHVVQLKNK